MGIENKLQNENDAYEIITRGHGGLLKPITVAIIIHIILFGILALFWQQSNQQRKEVIATIPEEVKINSYIITTEQYEAMVNAAKPINEKSHDNLDNQLSDIPAQPLNTEPHLIEPTTIVPTENKAVEKDIMPNESEVTDKALPRNKDHHTEFKQETSNNMSHVEKSSAIPTTSTSQDIRNASRQYLQQMKEQQFTALVGQQTASTNTVGSMSEMDPDLDFIEIHQKKDLSQPHSYNHKLDPNRIVKQGDYCYRVVNLATQVNPYGEGLGFAEFCGIDEQKIAMEQAIQNRIGKIK